ncbi:hypothetical protein WEB32_10700 [Streptomyces netropsis]|uniref:Uncharacterized protein n=1 Tax=Streptomyces netropsis TaxID=55404 RepID=A0A7W7L7F9_STRNE|nr:hypothetical protein [Streptomyces netropsis]MBB4884488.1 hypothetical protein [Streptomyces netropsis]GGR03347.1 hypothetical protein GCM10010219_04240 [Streptomyces netropsis]
MKPIGTAKPASERILARMLLPALSGRFVELEATARREQSSYRRLPLDLWQAEREAGPPQ